MELPQRRNDMPDGDSSLSSSGGDRGAKGARGGEISSRALAYQLLQLTRCSACEQPVREPVTLPCGHSSCLSCIIGHANGPLNNLSSLPSSSALPPRFPLSSTTVPCPMSGCPRGAIGRGVGVWNGFNAVYGDSLDEEVFSGMRTFTLDPPSRGLDQGQPLDGFIIPTNANPSGLGLVSAQSRSSFASKYAISKYSMQGNDIATESALLRTDVILSKTVDILLRYSGVTRQRPFAQQTRASIQAGRRSRHGFRARRRANAPHMLTEPTGTRTEINQRFLAVMGASEEGIDSCTVGGVAAVADDSSDEEDDFVQLDEAIQTEGEDPSEYDDDDEEIGGAFARTYDVAVRPLSKRARRYTLQRQNMLPTLKTEQEAMLSELNLHDGTAEEEKVAIDALHSELSDVLECQLCYMPLYQPLTTPCGHTFCSRCFARSLDHSTTCPLCRADMPAFSFFQEHPCNQAILKILTADIRPPSANIPRSSANEEGRKGEVEDNFDESGNIWGLAKLYQERKLALEREERESMLSTPIFVCTLGFPGMPTILHIFEPRYRLMVRRCLESGHPRFGMVLHSQDMSEPTPGMSPFGTMLEIKTVKMLPDGRSMIETVGSHRFRVLEKGSLDGYTVGRILPVEDVPAEAEGELEQASMGIFDLWEEPVSSPSSSSPLHGDSIGSGRNASSGPESDNDSNPAQSSSSTGTIRPFLSIEEANDAHTAFQSALGLDSLQREINGRQPQEASRPTTVNASSSAVQRSTIELIEKCTAFIETLRSGSAPWLITRLNDTYGPMPEPVDVAAFGYWMALVMPIDEHEKAKLLPIRSARLRLCIVVHWIEQLRQMWWFNNGCSVQ